MKRQNLIMLSPHHADCDYRVRRTIEVISKLFEVATVYWDVKYPGHQYKNNKPEGLANELYEKNKRWSFLRLLLRSGTFSLNTKNSIMMANVAYIHASGIEGLLYAREVKRINPKCLVIFDYHDSFAYELYYQLKKRGAAKLFKVSWRLYARYLSCLAQSVDALVGISKTQISEFKALAKKDLDAIHISNHRAFSSNLARENVFPKKSKIALIWLGNVMAGRDLNLISKWLAFLPTAPTLHIFGHIKDQHVATELQSRLNHRVRFYGSFQGEKEIVRSLPAMPVGLFLGWSDPQGTNINAHASPNKYFTYVNMELPIVLASSLSELALDVDQHHAGESIRNPAELEAALNKIELNYSKYTAGTKALKAHYAKNNPSKSLRDLLERTKSLVQ